MSFSSRRRNYLLTPHRRDGLVEFMKSMLTHSFVLDALKTTVSSIFLSTIISFIYSFLWNVSNFLSSFERGLILLNTLNN